MNYDSEEISPALKKLVHDCQKNATASDFTGVSIFTAIVTFVAILFVTLFVWRYPDGSTELGLVALISFAWLLFVPWWMMYYHVNLIKFNLWYQMGTVYAETANTTNILKRLRTDWGYQIPIELERIDKKIKSLTESLVTLLDKIGCGNSEILSLLRKVDENVLDLEEYADKDRVNNDRYTAEMRQNAEKLFKLLDGATKQPRVTLADLKRVVGEAVEPVIANSKTGADLVQTSLAVNEQLVDTMLNNSRANRELIDVALTQSRDLSLQLTQTAANLTQEIQRLGESVAANRGRLTDSQLQHINTMLSACISVLNPQPEPVSLRLEAEPPF